MLNGLEQDRKYTAGLGHEPRASQGTDEKELVSETLLNQFPSLSKAWWDTFPA